MYNIGSYGFATTECHMDFGVHVCFSLLWSDHVLQITKKANKMLCLLSKTFVKASFLVFSNFAKRIYVRPILEFSNGVWSPVLQRDIFLLEAVQRKAPRIPFGKNEFMLSRLPYRYIPGIEQRSFTN